ncbi:DUF3768 domain-containing protein [Methylobacterium sp.]|uniref:DUF3768 domain-containing protein n=1 Tax=Methylobacterium sp. TaxID=409 RepID=UPI003C775CE9
MPNYECVMCERREAITAFVPEACSSCGGTLVLTEAEQQAITERVATQNDRFRTTWGADAEVFGRMVFTPGVTENGGAFIAKVREAVRGFDSFTADNDPYGEHDFGAVTVEGVKVYWKIDLFDADYDAGSELRDDLAATRRVLTILLPGEY